MIRVTIWNEYRHEKKSETVKALYPNGIHATVKEILACEDIEVTLAALDDPEQGLPDEVLDNTDVLMWWGHLAHKEVDDALVERIYRRVHNGMGMVFMHSGHHSKPFSRIVGSTGNLTWGRDQRCIVWNLCPTHPITKGIPAHFELFEEMYGEPFYVPQPDEVLFATWYEDGNLFRGGLTYTRGLGKVFYFHPGHERCRSFYDPNVRRILQNAVRWCAPVALGEGFDNTGCLHQTEAVFKKEAP
jgi:trehalose utilization protein